MEDIAETLLICKSWNVKIQNRFIFPTKFSNAICFFQRELYQQVFLLAKVNGTKIPIGISIRKVNANTKTPTEMQNLGNNFSF